MRSAVIVVVVVIGFTSGCGLYYDDSHDECVPATERCNSLDDDCDGLIDEDFPTLGAACDGSDSDRCEDGELACSTDGRGVVCVDDGVFARDLCNGIDDDCDPATADGSGEPTLGTSCDGNDGDLCVEGSIVCIDGALVCNEDTGTNPEQCNQADDDCDGKVDEGFDLDQDVANCGYCGNTCTNANGTTACTAGACVPTCATGAEDCNGIADDGCEVFRDRNPTCTMPKNLGAIPGDTGTQSLTITGTDEEFLVITLQEISTGFSPVTGTIDLDSPAGVNFDLFVYCGSCGGGAMGSSQNAAGMRDEVPFRHEDVDYVNDNQNVYVEVRFVSATTCAPWSLTVTGHTNVASTTCGAP